MDTKFKYGTLLCKSVGKADLLERLNNGNHGLKKVDSTAHYQLTIWIVYCPLGSVELVHEIVSEESH